MWYTAYGRPTEVRSAPFQDNKPCPNLPDPPPSGSQFYTEASLRDVVSVQACHESEWCAGILLHYEDGTKAVVGKYYPEKLTSQHSPIGLGLACNDYDVYDRVRLVPDEKAHLGCGGVLSWWFGDKCNTAYITT